MSDASGSTDRAGTVVVPGVRAPHATTALRSLGRRGVDAVVVSEHASPPAAWSRYCDEFVRAPAPDVDAEGYRERLAWLAGRDDVRAVLALREADVCALVHDRDAFAGAIPDLYPSAEALEAVHDRLELAAVAERAGVAVPETKLLTEVADWRRERIVKGRYAVLTDAYDDALSGNALENPPKTTFLDPGEEPPVDELVDAMGHVPVAQAYVDGVEFCLRALYDDGEVVATSQKRLRRGYKYSRGPSVYHEAVDVPELEAAGLALLDELDWHGMASVGFVRDDDGVFTLLEVNPRLPASVPVDVHAGVDYPWLLWALATDGAVADAGAYRPGTASHLLRGELVHLHSVLTESNPVVDRPSIPGTVAEVGGSLAAQPRTDLLAASDPGPFLKDGLDAVFERFRSE